MSKVKLQRIISRLVVAGLLLFCLSLVGFWLLSFWPIGPQSAQMVAAFSGHRDEVDSALIEYSAKTAQRIETDTKPPEPIAPIPLTLALNSQEVALGKRLFHDVRLSENRSMSCASCHSNALGGADGLPTTIGRDRGRRRGLNTPTVWNSAFNFRQRWDGGVASLEEQINGPLLSPTEMNNSWPEVIKRLSQDQAYRAAFDSLYPSGIQPDTVRTAIATYERSLITPNARFDQYLSGDESAITEQEKRGYDLFKGYGCAACHQGINIGGNMFQRLGVMEDYFLARGNVQTVDLGRMNITGRVRDRYVFKVPSLRNIELTAPYLHDGSVDTLAESIQVMGRYQLGREIPAGDTAAIVSFLQTLTGTLPDAALLDTSEAGEA